MQSSPLPSRLALLCDLQKFDPGSKVRFLGCVTKYSNKDAILTLKHNYPRGNLSTVQLDVDLVLETMKSSDCQVGSWINVIGYIQSQNSDISSSSMIHVQAILIWPTGPSSLDAYEKVLSWGVFKIKYHHSSPWSNLKS